jgi:hypothetical protein
LFRPDLLPAPRLVDCTNEKETLDENNVVSRKEY